MRTHLGIFHVLTVGEEVVTQAMWLCEEHAGQVDWGVQVLEIPKGDEMKQSIRTRIEAAVGDDGAGGDRDVDGRRPAADSVPE